MLSIVCFCRSCGFVSFTASCIPGGVGGRLFVIHSFSFDSHAFTGEVDDYEKQRGDLIETQNDQEDVQERHIGRLVIWSRRSKRCQNDDGSCFFPMSPFTLTFLLRQWGLRPSNVRHEFLFSWYHLYNIGGGLRAELSSLRIVGFLFVNCMSPHLLLVMSIPFPFPALSPSLLTRAAWVCLVFLIFTWRGTKSGR